MSERLGPEVARCPGVGDDADGWREGCEDCVRRTDRETALQPWAVVPPAIIVFECEYRIAPGEA